MLPLRDYQRRCVDAAIDGQNLLVVLPTNSGKTRIAAEVVDAVLGLEAVASGKKCVFLAPTGPLVEQQGAVLAAHCAVEWAEPPGKDDAGDSAAAATAPAGRVARLGVVRGSQGLYGDAAAAGISYHNAWRLCDVVVMTPDLLVNSLVHACVRFEDLALIVFDEAHRLRGNAAYALLMQHWYASAEHRPRILALTASPLGAGSGRSKSWELATEEEMRCELADMEEKLGCHLWTDLEVESGADRREVPVTYQVVQADRDIIALFERAAPRVDPAATGLRKQRLQAAAQRWSSCRDRLLEILEDLGLWCAARALRLFARGEGELLEDTEPDSEEDGGAGRGGAGDKQPTAAPPAGAQAGSASSGAALLREAKQANEEARKLLADARAELARSFHLSVYSGELPREANASGKLQALVKLLRDNAAQAGAGGVASKTIVFAKLRATCQLLVAYLKQEKALGGDAAYVVRAGPAGGAARGALDAHQTLAHQRRAIAAFRAPAGAPGAVAVLVATAVLCEGVDVPACQLVVRWDLAATPLEQIQSRGRARSDGSVIAHLVSGPEDEASLQNFATYERRVASVLASWRRGGTPALPLPLADAEARGCLALTDPATGARLPAERAKGFLHTVVYGWYDMGLEEMLDFCEPGFRDNRKKHGYSMFDIELAPQGGFICTLELPPVGCCEVPVAEQMERARTYCNARKEEPVCAAPICVVRSMCWSTKDAATKDAALRACTVLHAIGVLDGNLRVAGRDAYRAAIAASSARGVGAAAVLAGRRKRSDDAVALRSTSEFVRELPRCLRHPAVGGARRAFAGGRGAAAGTGDLPAAFVMHAVALGSGEREWNGQRSLGLLLPEAVPAGRVGFLAQPPFAAEPEEASVERAGDAIQVSAAQARELARWSQAVLELAQVDGQCPLHPCFAPGRFIEIVPCSGRYVAAGSNASEKDPKRSRIAPVQETEPSCWLVAPVVGSPPSIDWDFLRWTLQVTENFVATGRWPELLSQDLPPSVHLPLEERTASCAAGVSRTAHASVFVGLAAAGAGEDAEPRAPLGATGAAPRVVEGRKVSRAARGALGASAEPSVLCRVECCELLPVSAAQFCLARLLPTLLWRLEFVAGLHELHKESDVVLATTTVPALGEALSHACVRNLPVEGPANRALSYERLEFLGDAALKLLAVVAAAASSPEADEGALSKAAQRHQTNRWLRDRARALRWTARLVARPFSARQSLVALRRQEVTQKVEADVVESILGAVFRGAAGACAGACAGSGAGGSLHRGVEEGWAFFRKAIADAGEAGAAMEIRAAIASAAAQPPQLSRQVCPAADAAAVLEKAFGYDFRDRSLAAALLVRADGSRPKAFQRLELVGDAVLQVAVSWHLAGELPDFDEGRLTLVRAAVVCNRHLARRLARRLGPAGAAAAAGGLFAAAPEPLRRAVAQHSRDVLESPESEDFVIGGDAASGGGGDCSDGARLKCLADTYEALVAAVLLDADGDLDRAWAVFRKDFCLDQALVDARVEDYLAEMRRRAKKELTRAGPAPAAAGGAEGDDGHGGEGVVG